MVAIQTLNKFKAGDTVTLKFSCSGVFTNQIYTIFFKKGIKYEKDPLWATTAENIKNDIWGCHCQDNWILIDSRKEYQNVLKTTIITNFINPFLTKGELNYESK